MNKLFTLKTWFLQSLTCIVVLGILIGDSKTDDGRAMVFWFLLIVVPSTCAVFMLIFSLLLWTLPKGKAHE